MTFVWLLTASVLTWWLTGRFRLYAVSRQIVDVPNARSSHGIVMPRGGGLAIVATVTLGMALLAASGALPWNHMVGLVGAGIIAATVGFLDDLWSLSALTRLAGHATAALWLLGMYGPQAQSVIPIGGLDPWISTAVAATYLVWLLNLTNFMDGIDGIASVEAITVCFGGALVCELAAPGSARYHAPALLGFATVGFLYWNWPPARIFLGDSGSGFLGITMGALSLQAGILATPLFWSWIILLGVFISDATVTLLRRIARRERFHEAHRSHAYQHLTRRLGVHRPVTIAVGIVNIVWLLPISACVAVGWMETITGVFVAYLPLVIASVWLKAGCYQESR